MEHFNPILGNDTTGQKFIILDLFLSSKTKSKSANWNSAGWERALCVEC